MAKGGVVEPEAVLKKQKRKEKRALAKKQDLDAATRAETEKVIYKRDELYAKEYEDQVDKSSKDQKKKKHKFSSESLDQDAKESDLKSGLTEEKLKNDNGNDFKEVAQSKDKKKKNKPTTECLVEDQKLNKSRNCTVLVADKNSSDGPLDRSEVKPKEKKRKKEGKENKSSVTTEDVADTMKRERRVSTKSERIHLDPENVSSHEDIELHVKLKSKKGKKMDSHGETDRNSDCDSQVDKSSKDQNKKKHKFTSESFDQDAKQSDLSTGLSEVKLKNENCVDFREKAKSKDRKKKNKPTTECLVEDQKLNESKNSTVLVDNKSNSDIPLDQSEVKCKEKKKKKEGKEKKSLVTTEDVPDTKKRKRSAPTENESEPVEESVHGEYKRRKTEGLEEFRNVEQNGIEKHSKEENGEVNLNDGKESTYNQIGVSFNGISRNGVEKSGQKKQWNGSAEPNTVNAFRRVKADEVEFIDERLKDNSYWAKDGAETGYGAKAQEVLGQVRGRDFRHEKTKKKRGSYRGGQIDLQSHSIKFNYSDEE